MITVILTLLLSSLVAAPPTDVTGRWEGTVTAARDDGTTDEDRALVILKQKDGVITGTIGGGEDDQHPITTGAIEGDKVTISATHTRNGREFRIELTVNGDEMKGTVETGNRRGDVRLKRQKT